MSKSNETPSPVAAAEQAVAHLPEMMLALTRLQTTMFDAVMRQNIEWLDFLKQRFERDRQLVSQIAAANDPADAARLWSEFWRKAGEDYATEPRRLSEIAQTTLGSALSRARHDADDLLHVTKSTAV